MNSIEKEKLFHLVMERQGEACFQSFAPEQETYYLPYAQSKHMQTLSIYDSTELKMIREKLMILWADEQAKKETVPIILSGVRKATMEPEKRLPDIDLYNYMM